MMILGHSDRPELEFEITQDELDFLHKYHNGRAVKEMTEHPGWPILLTTSQNIIGRMETEHLGSASRMDRDRYWIQGAELNGARKYAKLLTETLAQMIASTDANYIRATRKLDITELDGDLNAEND